MSEIVIYSILIVVLLAVGIFFGMYIGNLKTKVQQEGLLERNRQLQSQFDELKLLMNTENVKRNESFQQQLNNIKENLSKTEHDREEIRREKDFLNVELARRNSEFENLRKQNIERDEAFKTQQEQLRRDFELLANKILEEKSSKFTEQNKENIKNILTPLQEKIQHFEKKVEDSQKENVGLHFSLKTQLDHLKDLNKEMTTEANNLTKALKGDSKAQGNWGELVLENVLEKSGLMKGTDYLIQKSLTNENDLKVIPDIIINLPDGKKMIIDSKVSLTAYEKYSSTEIKAERELFLKEHIKSIKTHITTLSNKKYEDLYKTESPDFVLMFIPIEPALYIAQNRDKDFFYSAFSNNILLVSPTTLLSTLKTIDNLWKNERQQQNAVEIAKHATSLYTKFKNLLDNLEIVGNRLKSTTAGYDHAMKKLTGNQNLIKDIDRLEKLGVSPPKKIKTKWLEQTAIEDVKHTENNDEESKLL